MMEEQINNEGISTESTVEDNEIGYTVFYGDSEEIAKALAINHIRNNATKDQFIVERPHIHVWQIFYGVMLPVLIVLICVFFCLFNQYYPLWAFVGTLMLCILFTIKRFVILVVLVYQRFAPESLRKACVFEPTCSNYMLMSIEKYGFWKGFFKGIKRLFRCHPPNGGVDYP